MKPARVVVALLALVVLCVVGWLASRAVMDAAPQRDDGPAPSPAHATATATKSRTSRPPAPPAPGGRGAGAATSSRAPARARAHVEAWRLGAARDPALAGRFLATARRMDMPPASAALAETDSDAAGGFTLANLEAGSWRVVATFADGRRAAAVADVTETAPRARVALVAGDGGLTLRGRAVRPDGAAFAGWIGVRRSADPEDARVWRVPDEEGRFQFGGLPAGDTQVHAVDPGRMFAATVVALPHEGEFVFVVGVAGGRTRRGRVVVLEDGSPVAGAAVVAHGSGRSATTRTVSDAQGRFEVPWTGWAAFEASADGFVSAKVRDSGVTDEVTLRLERTGVIVGRVVAADGAGPVAGAVVHVAPSDVRLGSEPAVARSADDGTFRVEDVAPGETSVYVQGGGWISPGLAAARKGGFNPFAVQLEPAATVSVELGAERAARVEGTVTDAEGAPVARVSVAQRQETVPSALVPWSTRATTDDAGTFAFDDLLPDAETTLAACPAASCPTFAAPVRPAAGATTRVDIRLAPRRLVHVTVLADGTDAPVAGALVRAAPTPRPGFLDASATGATDCAGEADLGPVAAGAITVTASAPGYVPQLDGVTAEEIDATRLRAVIRLVAAKPLVGRVVAPEGVVLDQLTIYASQPFVQGAQRRINRPPTYARAEADGSFRFDTLPDEEWSIHASVNADGRIHQAQANARPGGDPVVLELARSGKQEIRVRVLDEAGAPIAAAQLRTSFGAFAEVTDGAAILTLPPVPCSGTVEVRQPRSSTGRAPLPGSATVPIDVPSPAPAELEIRVPAERRISGRVVDADGAAVAGVRIVAQPDEGPYAYRRDEEAHAVTTTGADGSFELRRLGALGYRLSAAVPPGFARVAAVQAPGGATGVEIRLARGAETTITVLDFDGRPVGGCSVFANPVWARTSPAGVARLAALAPGVAIDLSISPPAERAELLPATLRGWTPRDTEIRLDLSFAIAGVVRDAAGRAVADAKVFHARGAQYDRRSPWGGVQSTAAGPDGRFRIPGLRAGEVLRVRASPPRAENLDTLLQQASATATAGDEGVVLVIETEASVRIRVDGVPPGASLRYSLSISRAQGAGGFSTGAGGTLPQDGVVHLSGLVPSGQYRFAVGPTPDGLYALSELLVPGGDEVVLRMQRGEPLDGCVVLPAGVRAEGVKVTAGWNAWSAQTTLGADGRFRFPGLPPGQCVVSAYVWAENRMTWQAPAVVTAAGATDVTLELQAAAAPPR